MAKKKRIRKSITINGKKITERFTTKEKAEQWYSEMYNRKKFAKSGVALPVDDKVTLNFYFDNEWFKNRKAEYREGTWGPDKQRFDDYLRDTIGPLPISKVSSPAVKAVLQNLVTQKGLSPKTRDRVRALISAIFNDAISRETPLASFNPTYGLKFKGKRVGKSKVSVIEHTEAVMDFLRTASMMTRMHFLLCSFFLMSGVRKQELIALMWDCVDLKRGVVTISRKYLQFEDTIIKGTKMGEETSRDISLSPALLKTLREHKEETRYSKQLDFVFCGPKGHHLSPRNVSTLINQVVRKSGIKVTVHGLRHTFGREFTEKSGNMKALQELLGHSNIKTTELYSELGSARLQKFGGVLDYSFDKEDE